MADRPRQTTPISPSPALGSTPTRPRPRPAATAPSGGSRLRSQAVFGGGRKAVPQSDSIKNYKTRKPLRQRPARLLPRLTTRQRPHPMRAEPGKKGARVRMRLRKAMLTPRGQLAAYSDLRIAGSSRFPALAPLLSLKPSSMSFFRGPSQDAAARF